VWRAVDATRRDGRKCYTVKDEERGLVSVHKFDTAKEAGRYALLLNKTQPSREA
jgi:hypothetical protein